MLKWVNRSGHATVVAYLALFLAIGGGAFAIAGGHKISGKKLKKRSTPANRLKKHTITGTEVNLNKLGKVPTAVTADVALSLANTTPVKITRTTSSSTQASFAAAEAGASPVVLYDDSHFQIYGKCFIDTSVIPNELNAYQFIATKQNGAIFDSDDDELSGNPPNGFLDVGTAENLREMHDESAQLPGANVQFEGDPEFQALAADGYILRGDQGEAVKFGSLPGGDGQYGAGDVCLFSLTTAHS